MARSKKSTTKTKPKKQERDDWYSPDESGQNNLNFLKAKPGEVSRVKLMDMPHREYCSYIEENDIKWILTLTEYEIVNGKYKELEPGLDQETSGKPPVARYIVPVIVYDVDKKGQMGKKDRPSDVEYKFALWAMSLPIYERLFAQYETWGDDLFEHDLLLTGVKKGTFEFFDTISVAKDSICMHKSIADEVQADYENYRFKESFKTMVAKTVTEEELENLLAGKSGD